MYEDWQREIVRFFSAKKIDCEVAKVITAPRFLIFGVNLKSAFDIDYINKKTLNQLNSFFKPHRIEYTFVEGCDFGIATPYKNFAPVRAEVIFGKKYFNTERGRDIVVPIGKDTEGNIVELNLSKAHNVLIAGSTGSGKSVLVDTIIASIMYHTHPDNVEFYLFDPKRVGVAKWKYRNNEDKRTAVEIRTETEDIVKELKFLVYTMEKRYGIMARHNIEDFHRLPVWDGTDIFVVVDELADLMLNSNYDIEEYLVKLAQKGRACGIHLILATQNPLAKVCTSLLKANMPCKVALKCANMKQSMVVLDHKGAESLLGQGDGIISLPYKTNEIRFQTAITANDSIKQIINQAFSIHRDFLESKDFKEWEKRDVEATLKAIAN